MNKTTSEKARKLLAGRGIDLEKGVVTLKTDQLLQLVTEAFAMGASLWVMKAEYKNEKEK